MIVIFIVGVSPLSGLGAPNQVLTVQFRGVHWVKAKVGCYIILNACLILNQWSPSVKTTLQTRDLLAHLRTLGTQGRVLAGSQEAWAELLFQMVAAQKNLGWGHSSLVVLDNLMGKMLT